jgi:RHS repeat-associated protein
VTDYDTAGSSLVSKTHYYYDQFPLMDRTSMTGHDPIYTTSFTNRSNLTTTARWLAGENRWISTKVYYDILGNVVQTTDARNYSSTIDYSSAFQYVYPTQAVNAKGHTAATNYSFYTGQVLSSTDANGQTSTNTYDSLNRLSRSDYPDGSYVRYTYDLTPNNFSTTVYKLVAPGQESSATAYQDGIGRKYRSKISDPAGDIFTDTQYQYDSAGTAAKVSNPYRLGETVYWTETQYDALGRVSKVIPPDGSSTANRMQYIYDLDTPAKTVIDAAGKQKRYEYDAAGRVFRITEPDSSGQLTLATTYNYMPSGGQPGLVITQGTHTITYVYDTLGRRVSATYPESGTTTYVYDDNGNMTQKTDARGWVTNYTYDELNRLTGKTYQNDGGVTTAVAISYDTTTNGIGKPAGWASGNNSGSSSYDIMGRVTSSSLTIAGDTHSMQESFVPGGELITTTFPNGFTATNGYDSIGNLETITSSFAGNLVTNIDRNTSGSWTLINYGNGVSNARTYNSNLQLKSIRVSNGNDYFYKTYEYNEGFANNGKIATITDNLDSTKSIAYTYDELNRLATAATSGPDWGLSWGYDRYGNRLNQAVTKGTAPSDAPSINSANNRISTWTYDAVGNVTNDGRNTYAYDAENRIISINSGATTYTYDAGGSRLPNTTGTTTIRYYFGVAEKTNSSWTKILIGTPAGTVEWDNGTMLYKSNDHLGTPRIITNASGAVIGHTDLFPFGEVWAETGTSTKFKFSGKERDSESGNDYFGERYNNSNSGRFLTVDPVIHLNDPQSFNAYVYTRNDPINLLDPDGADWMEGPGGIGIEYNPWMLGYMGSIAGDKNGGNNGLSISEQMTLAMMSLPNIGPLNWLNDISMFWYQKGLDEIKAEPKQQKSQQNNTTTQEAKKPQPSQTTVKNDYEFFAQIEVDLVVGTGVTASIGLVLNPDNIVKESGVFVTAGDAQGVNLGASAGGGGSKRKIDGTATSVDLNIPGLLVSPTFVFDDKGFAGGNIGVGPGVGLDVTNGGTIKFTIQAVIDELKAYGIQANQYLRNYVWNNYFTR